MIERASATRSPASSGVTPDGRVRQEPYFVHAPDDLVWASYTDARGELTTEHIPAETSRDDVIPASHEAEY